MRLCRTALLLCLITPLMLRAQEARTRPQYSAVRATVAPIIDGDLSDAVWQNAPEITGFTQREPNEGQAATQQTRLRVVYDEEAIYFGMSRSAALQRYGR